MKIIIVYEIGKNIRLKRTVYSYREAGHICDELAKIGNKIISVTRK